MKDILPGPQRTLESFSRILLDEPIAGSRVPFLADDGVHGWELWAGRAAILTHQPRRALEDLRAELETVGLPSGLEKVLRRALDAASRALLEPGGSAEAIDALERFRRKVELLSPAQIDDARRTSLLEFAEEIAVLIDG